MINADHHHVPVRVEPVEESRHASTGDYVDDDVVTRRSIAAGAIQHLGRAELAQALAAFGRGRRDRHRAGPAAHRELDRHDPDASSRTPHQH
jgi:hypothetical protein